MKMDKRSGKMLAATLLLGAASCGGEGKLTIRSTPTGLAGGAQTVSFRVAEALGQYALGNVALAAEGFRKALREEPASVDAMIGLAACYDRMGRFDLSRRHYEAALAIAPGDARLYAGLAGSLTAQGRSAEAEAVRSEMTQRLAKAAEPVAVAKAAPVDGPQAVAVAVEAPKLEAPQLIAKPVEAPRMTAAVVVEPMIARSVTIAVPVVRSAPRTVVHGPRLERLSLGEVALVTTSAPLWRAQLVERSTRSATIRFTPLGKPGSRTGSVVLLNAARSAGLAARTRTYLAQRGWSRIRVGNAPRTLTASTILYPASRRATAVRLANQFGFALRHVPSADGTLVIFLGRDAAANRALQARGG